MLDDIQRTLTNYGLKSKTPKRYGEKTAYDITYSTNESYLFYKLFYKNQDQFTLLRKKKKFEEGFRLRANTKRLR